MPHPTRISVTIALAAMIALPPPVAPARAASAPTAAQLGRAIDAWAKPYVDRNHLMGQLIVSRGGRVLVERSYGWANLELRVPITPGSRACVASISKPMTVQIALKLIEQRTIGYRDSIARWIPGFPKGDSITVEHLVRHRAGIPHEILPDSESTRPRTAAEMVEYARRRTLEFPPGSQSMYSTGGFTVLARVLEIAGGKDYDALLQQYVCGPLGMKHTLHTDGVALLPGRVSCYVPSGAGVVNNEFQDFSGLVGGGSVWSNARDIHAFLRGVIDGKLGENTRASWVRNGRVNFNGQSGGFRAYAVWDSASDLGIVWVGNVVTGAPGRLQAAITKLAAGEPAPRDTLPALDPRPLSDAELGRWEGRYRLGNGTRLELRVRGGGLYVNDWAVLRTLDGRYFSPRDYGIVVPVRGADGRYERLDWIQNGETYPAPRIPAG